MEWTWTLPNGTLRQLQTEKLFGLWASTRILRAYEEKEEK
jgi:hypothetical protein